MPTALKTVGAPRQENELKYKSESGTGLLHKVHIIIMTDFWHFRGNFLCTILKQIIFCTKAVLFLRTYQSQGSTCLPLHFRQKMNNKTELSN